ncbi:MAG TPA: beta-ribofuranosylaminobenzene 5'-phosphate synthase family protein [Methylotenera sp.]|nr:beta-ribofuranosylaminobenzene 5'-phosphate synthase family protein [Methylotenera sp.]
MTKSEVLVNSSARLHMGFFDLHGGLGRKFGSIGLALTAPSVELSAVAADKLNVIGVASERAVAISTQLISKLQLSGSVNLHIQQHIPEHAGLGSGTQLALAIGAAINQLYNLNLSTEKIAELTGRGGRSGIGIAAFNHGGLLIDGGRSSGMNSASSRKENTKVPPLLARYNFPEQWRILLIFDTTQPGIHGEDELAAFSQLPVFSENLAAHLCRHVLMQAMPALVEQDLSAFGRSIQELQAHVGDYFAPAQGGRYASKQVGAVLQYLENIGIACFGQSSWGPTGFAVFESAGAAEQHLQQLKLKFTNDALTWMICEARNHGADVTLLNDCNNDKQL